VAEIADAVGDPRSGQADDGGYRDQDGDLEAQLELLSDGFVGDLGLMLCRYVLRLQPIASASVDEVIADVAPAIQRRLDEGATSS
jgi:hypothetical protein